MPPTTIPTITPIDMRLAYHYMLRGLGWHRISDNPKYDEVLVREMIEWNKLAGRVPGVEYGAIVQVAFYRNGDRVRFVDFAMLASGGGGQPILQLVTTPPQEADTTSSQE